MSNGIAAVHVDEKPAFEIMLGNLARSRDEFFVVLNVSRA